jgi:hypothetical protein
VPNAVEKQRAALIKAINLYPGWREPWLKLAEVAWNQEDYGGCAAYAEAALKIPKPTGVLFAENSKNYLEIGGEGYRLAYIGYTRLAQKMMQAGEDCREILQRALDIDDKHGCGATVSSFGWKLAYVVWLPHNKEIARAFFDKCYLFDSKTYEVDRHLFYPNA